MKQRRQRILAVMLAAAMAVPMVACGNSGSGNDSKEQESASSLETGEKESGAGTEEEEAEAEGTDGQAEPDSLLPYTGEEITFSFFWFDTGIDYAATETMPIAQALQDRLGNIRLELELLPVTDYDTKIPLILTSGELPDLMVLRNPANYISSYAQNGIFLDWEPLLEEYMPNCYQYSQKMAMYAGLRDAEGHAYGIPNSIQNEDHIMKAWMANATLLESMEIEAPKTQEEFLEACRRIKAETGITPIQHTGGLASLVEAVGFMYKTDGDRGLSYYAEEGKWDFGPAREDSELKELLTFMHTLWEENLIDHEINTMTKEQYNDYVYDGKFAFSHGYYSDYSHGLKDRAVLFQEEAGFEIEVIPTPAASGAGVIIRLPADGACSWGIVSNVNTEHPELLAACVDLLFSEEMTTYRNYGIEGETYEIGEDGEKYFTDKVLAASNGYSGNLSLADLGSQGSAWLSFGVNDTKAQRLLDESPRIHEGVNRIIDMLDAGELDARYSYEYPVLTEEESAEIADNLTPVETYLDECMAKFIMGDMNLDSDWDAFMSNLLGYGDMDKVCEILNSKKMPDYAGNWR